jgi:hypothetical protein
MNYGIVILTLALVGCGRREAVLAESVRVMKHVHEWIPSGTPIASAEVILDAHQFRWSVMTNSSFADATNATLLVCHPVGARSEAKPAAPQKWSVVLVITNGNVSSVHLAKATKDS